MNGRLCWKEDQEKNRIANEALAARLEQGLSADDVGPAAEEEVEDLDPGMTPAKLIKSKANSGVVHSLGPGFIRSTPDAKLFFFFFFPIFF